MLVCPSDHHIADDRAFRAAAARGGQLAAEDWLVSFGITPTAPETGYGYIEQGEPLPGGCRVERFVEKPDLATAQRFLADGGYSWNGGIFALPRRRLPRRAGQAPPGACAAVRRGR